MRVLLVILIFLGAGVWYLGWALTSHGFSAREKPPRLEEMLARRARQIATPGQAKEMKNPQALSAENMNEVREHWAGHCAGAGDHVRLRLPRPPHVRG